MKTQKNIFLLIAFLAFLLTSCNNDDTPTPAPPASEPNIQKYVTVTRDAGSEVYSFKFTKQGKWDLYKGKTIGEIDMSAPAGSSSGNELTINGLDSTQRYFFKLKLDDVSQAYISETQIAVHGQPNMRDLGGIVNKDGKSVVWGKVYRSGELGKLTDSDVKYLESMDIDNIIDFRFEEEFTESPDRLPEGVNYISLPVEDSLMHRSVMTKWLLSNNAEGFDTLLIYWNKLFVTKFQNEYKEYFNILEEGKTTLFHCTAGKDRAGLAAALFLYALDVDEETIMANYLKSNDYLKELNQKTVDYVNSMGLNGELLWPVLLVKEEYLRAAINTIDSEYGGMDNYLKNILDVDVDKLKELYLEGQ
jgi:protein-tyrosine phosphatase